MNLPGTPIVSDYLEGSERLKMEISKSKRYRNIALGTLVVIPMLLLIIQSCLRLNMRYEERIGNEALLGADIHRTVAIARHKLPQYELIMKKLLAERHLSQVIRNPTFSGSEKTKSLKRELYKHRIVAYLIDYYVGHGRMRRASYLRKWLDACWKYGDPNNRRAGPKTGKHPWSFYISLGILLTESQITNVAVSDIHARGESGSEVTAAQIVISDMTRLFTLAKCKGKSPKIVSYRGGWRIVRRGAAWEIDNVVLMMLYLLDEKMGKLHDGTSAIVAYNSYRKNANSSIYWEKVNKNIQLLKGI